MRNREMANQPFIVIRKPTTPKGWTISIAVLATVAGIVGAWAQSVKSDIHALGDSQHEIKTSLAVVQNTVDSMKDDIKLLKQEAFKPSIAKAASAQPEGTQ